MTVSLPKIEEAVNVQRETLKIREKASNRQNQLSVRTAAGCGRRLEARTAGYLGPARNAK